MARKYELNKRAETQEETRRRIVDATVALHEEVGPARTTITAIAGRAGVERLTVYRHFPDDQDIFHACSARFNELHPLPDPMSWLAVADPGDRLRRALPDMYAYYVDAAPMLSKVFNDAPNMPSMRHAVENAVQRRKLLVEVVVSAWNPANEYARKRVFGAVSLAFSFDTWDHLVQMQGLSTDEAVELMVSMIDCIADPSGAESSSG